MMKFSGKRLREAIEERGLTDRQLGRMIGRAYQTVNAWKFGDTAPNANDLPKLAVALDKSLSYFYTDNDNSCHDPVSVPVDAPACPGEAISTEGEG